MNTFVQGLRHAYTSLCHAMLRAQSRLLSWVPEICPNSRTRRSSAGHTPMKCNRPPVKCTSNHKCVETPERPCKVSKSCHQNGMGCEDQNLIKALWRSQAPLPSLCIHLASVWEKRIFVFITIPSYSCVLLPPPLLSRTPSIRYCNLYPPLTYIQEYSQWNITSVLHLGTRRTNSAQNRLLEVLFHFQVLLHSRKVCMQTLRQYVICAMP